jgi:Mg-chelatase subunit ChlD
MAWAAILVLLTAVAAQGQPEPRKNVRTADQVHAEASRPAPEKKSAAPRSTAAAAPQKKSGASATTPRQPVGPSADAAVRVRTQEEMRKPRSPFLYPPGAAPGDRYGSSGAADWNDLPPWRQASFFGIRAQGQLFVYVVDCSGSMSDDDRFPRATMELRRSVFALQPPQQFEVIFYNDESIPMPGGPTPRPADQRAKSLLLSWLRLIEPDSGTDPRPALRQALALKPDAVFLLSDGAYPEGTADAVARLNTRRVPIHTVDITGGLAGDQLKRIAQSSGGQYASRPGNLQGGP